MIWSVSILGSGSGACGCVEFPRADVSEVAGDGGGCGHLRRDEVGAATAALAALEVAVRCGGATLAGCEDVRVHAEAHAAAGLAPLKAGGLEDGVEAFLLGLALDGLRAGDDHGANFGGDVVAVDDLRCGAQVLDAPVGAGAEEDGIDSDIADGLARL